MQQQQILKYQTDIAAQNAYSEEQIFNLEQLKELSTSLKEGNSTITRVYLLLSHHD